MKRSKRLAITVLALIITLTMIAQPAEAKGSAASDNSRALSSGISCANPMPSSAQHCRQLEAQILASTVRLVLHVRTQTASGGFEWRASTSHGTVKDGRFVVTHNHWSLASFSNPQAGQLVLVSVHAADGRLLWEGPQAAVTLVAQSAETLVLDFGTQGGQGLFASLGVPSARFGAWTALSLQSGIEVAEINWDGARTSINWVRITAVVTSDGTPRLELANYVQQGASGGGIFWNGVHVANNWAHVTTCFNSSCTLTRRYSLGALNAAQIAGQMSGSQIGGGVEDTSGGAASF